MRAPIRVLIVDDDPAVCSGLAFILKHAARDEIEVVATAHDGAEAITAVQSHRIDVVLMDIQMPQMDGITATKHIRALPDPPQVLILTTVETADEPVRAAAAGAIGFLLKSEDPERYIRGIRDVAAGEGTLSPRTSRQLMHYIGADETGARRQAAQRALAQLTDRELDVAKLVAGGLSNAEIAGELYLSASTVKTHLSAIQDKLQVDNRVLIAVEVTRALG